MSGKGGLDPRHNDFVAHLMSRVFVPPAPGIRGWRDGIGYTVKEASMREVLHRCNRAAAPRWEWLKQRYDWSDDVQFAAAICPHDDYYYAGRFYSLVLPYMTGDLAVIFGVSHLASRLDLKDQLIFDGYEKWFSPFGLVEVSELRDAVVRDMPAGTCFVSNDVHQIEHSIEAIIPFLYAFRPGLKILPVIVPTMRWERLLGLSEIFAGVLADKLGKAGLSFSRDVHIICSSDAVHYGDDGLGGMRYAPFGTGVNGYLSAEQQDRDIIESHLCGPVRVSRMQAFLGRFCDPDNPARYRVTWCGRFSVTLGLLTAAHLTRLQTGKTLDGFLLDYGTSVSEMSLVIDDIDGIGVTAPNNFHHFVGYASVGYRVSDADSGERS